MTTSPVQSDELLTPSQVAAILFVDPKTVTRWAIAGKVGSIRTPGGHRRYLRSEILSMLSGLGHGQHQAPVTANGYEPPLPPDPRWTSGDVDRPGGPPQAAHQQAVAAAAVVAEAVAIARQAVADQAAQSVTMTREAVSAAADRAAYAAETARSDRATAAAVAAEAVANDASKTAAAMQSQADASAVKLTKAAARAASTVFAANPPGTDREAALTALQVAATVKAAAVATAEEVAAAAAQVASAVAAAAREVAFRVSALDIAIESQVAKVAVAVQTAATAAARQVAADTDARASSIAMVAQGAVDDAASVAAFGGSASPPSPARTLPGYAGASSSASAPSTTSAN